jgi:hypothetical protein
MVDTLTICGKPSDIAKRVRELSEAGVDHVIQVPAGRDPLAMMVALGTSLAS